MYDKMPELSEVADDGESKPALFFHALDQPSLSQLQSLLETHEAIAGLNRHGVAVMS